MKTIMILLIFSLPFIQNFPQPPDTKMESGNAALMVAFSLAGFEDAKEVVLAGSFNNWDEHAYKMKKVGDSWQFRTYLEPGKHTYKFIVDGNWIMDPGNKIWEENEHATGNAVLWIGSVFSGTSNVNDSVWTGESKSKYKYTGRFTSTAQNELLADAGSISDITPYLWEKMGIPANEGDEFQRRKDRDFSQLYYIYQRPYDYSSIIEYVSTEISGIFKGNEISAEGKGSEMTAEQKYILNNTDLGSDVLIKIDFRYKKIGNDPSDCCNKIIHGQTTVTIVPEKEAESRGGFNQFSDYLNQNVFDKISDEASLMKVQRAVVKFTVNEKGQVVDALISKTSTDENIDKLILEAINKMPGWKPAETSKGTKVKQEFSIPMGNGGC